MFPEFDSSKHVITVDKMPDWAASGDVVHRNGNRLYVRSLTQTETRWRSVVRRARRVIAKWFNIQ